MISKNYKVKKIGYEGENPIAPIIMIDGNERVRLGLNRYDVVKVVRKVEEPIDLQSLALVQPQFKEFVNQEVASVNTKLAEALQLQVDDVVEITKEVTESEALRFKEELHIRR